MVFDDGEGESEGGDVDIFVGKVDSGVTLDVSEEIHGLIEMRDCVCLVTDEVVQAVCAVCIDEAVTNPLSSSDTVQH